MKAAIYARVSTEAQDSDNQLPACQDYAKQRGWEVTGIYQENGSSWKDGHQPELARLLRELRTGQRKYDRLIVFAIDRICRGGPIKEFALMNSFEDLDCLVVSVCEDWIPTEPGIGREICHFFLAHVARYESERKSQNTKLGLAKARAIGKTLGRPTGAKDKKKRLKKRPVIYRNVFEAKQPEKITT